VTLVGTELQLEIGAVAHGGHFVARYEGRVVFVRHCLPGEVVRAVVTEGADDARFLRADAVEVLTPSPDRVTAPSHLAEGGHFQMLCQGRFPPEAVVGGLGFYFGSVMHHPLQAHQTLCA
jgi:tRNA/tmRNA/rRNA uracil-C5-methylase (TrmA/RlmC/RlmD family)